MRVGGWAFLGIYRAKKMKFPMNRWAIKKCLSKIWLLWIIIAFMLVLNCSGYGRDNIGPTVKSLSIYVRADVNEVRFRNVWFFERKQTGGKREIKIELPKKPVKLVLEDPDNTYYNSITNTLSAEISSGSLVDSVAYTFSLANEAGTCETELPTNYPVELIRVYVSGPATRISSNTLVRDEYVESRSNFSHVYKAVNVGPDARVAISLSGLPRIESRVWQIVCTAGLVLIIAGALFTIYHGRNNENN